MAQLIFHVSGHGHRLGDLVAQQLSIPLTQSMKCLFQRVFTSYQARSLPLLVTVAPVHRREIPSNDRRVSHYQQTDIRSPTALKLVPTTSAPNVVRKFDRHSNCRRVPDQHAHARAIHPTEPTLGPRRVSLRVRGAWPSPENSSARRADTSAAVLFRGEQHPDRAAPITRRRTPESDLELLPACSRCV